MTKGIIRTQRYQILSNSLKFSIAAVRDAGFFCVAISISVVPGVGVSFLLYMRTTIFTILN
jgi:hypothetical protein